MRTPNFIRELGRLARSRPMMAGITGMVLVFFMLLWWFQPFSGGGTSRTVMQTQVGPIVPVNPQLQSSLAAMQARLLAMEQANEKAQTELLEAQRQLQKQEEQRLKELAAEQRRREQAQKLTDERIAAALERAQRGRQAELVKLEMPPQAPKPSPLRQILPAKQPALAPARVVTLPVGSVAQGLLLHGVFSTTNQAQTGIPTTFKVTGQFKTPQGRVVTLKSCHMVGNAAGQTAAARLEVELKLMSCVLPSGKAWSAPVKGYITGKDNVLGIPGHLETRDFEKLQRILLAALTAIPGHLVESTTDQVTALGPLGATIQGGAGPLEAVSREAAKLYIDEARQFASVLWVRPHQRAYLYTLEPLPIPDWVVASSGQAVVYNAID